MQNQFPSPSAASISAAPAQGFVFGNRIPKDYFITSGMGESEIALHAGSYHLALRDAGIERANIMTYSSIMPGIATERDKPAEYVHGSVMETIMAVANGTAGDWLSAGIIIGWLRHRVSGELYGGLVCEHSGTYPSPVLEEKLHASLNELYVNGFEDDYLLNGVRLIQKSGEVTKLFGTVLVAICFISYVFPAFSP